MFLAYRREKNYYEEELVKREEKEINVNEALLYRDYLRGMRIRIKVQRDIVLKAKGDFDIKQNELLNATKKRKVLEKVKEKEWKRFKENIERRERILVDEAGMRKYQRSM